MTQEVLAGAAGIDRVYVSWLERQRHSATIDTIERLAKALGVQPHILLMPN